MAVIPDTHNTGLTPTQIDTAFSNALTHTPSDSTPKEDGSGSAGEAETFARSDHEHPHDTTKQDTLAFEGTYNASTNKAATMSAVKDGKLTGYAQASGNVAANDKIIEAIGKVEKKADDNKTNILYVADQTTKYNICDYTTVNTSQYPDSSTGATISFDSTTYEYNINGTTNSSGVMLSNIYFDTATTKAIPDGEWVVQIYPTHSQITLNAVTTSPQTGTSQQPLVFSVTQSDSRSWVRIELGKNITFNNFKFKLMIVPKSIWDAGFTTYQAYAMSNVELTAAIQAIQAQLANT